MPGWKKPAFHAVGGLIQVGYIGETDFLLVLSHNGRGIFDCLTGEKIARDDTMGYEFFDEKSLILKGFGQFEKDFVQTAGLHGGKLKESTTDGWRLSYTEDGIGRVILSDPNDSISETFGDSGLVEIRAFGFSESGKSFVLATTADLTIFSRA